ncbi:MAG: hypothetical protein A2170_11680 [Deltaproteobacteria bacterium RBG_13_53_10]|nr:MAG: hypothetical protein A2170_11680 [Deltaproteobacteria bacterium RBG_13_53_10]
MKLPAHKAGLPGKEIYNLIVPLDPAYKAGLAGHLPVIGKPWRKERGGFQPFPRERPKAKDPCV